MRNFSKWGLRPSSLPVGTCFLSGAATLCVLDQFVAPSWGQLFCGFGKCKDLWSKGYRARRRMGAVCAWIRFCVHEMLGALPGPALVSPFFVFNVAVFAVCGSFHLLGVVVNIFATSSAVALAAKLDLSCWTGCVGHRFGAPGSTTSGRALDLKPPRTAQWVVSCVLIIGCASVFRLRHEESVRSGELVCRRARWGEAGAAARG